MNQQYELLERFYSAFQQLDWETMAACYHRDVSFKDPAFELNGADAGKMWKMLCTRAKDFELSYEIVEVNDTQAVVNWQANYLFSKTGRKVNNKIKATIVFKDGLIYQHDDNFNFWRWSRQALGLPGYILGWSGAFQSLVSKQAMGQLSQFQGA